jgi:hypothetical protein
MAMFSSPTVYPGSSKSTDYSPAASTSTESVSLSWTAPTTRADGGLLLLSELEGYRIYYGKDKDNLQAFVDLLGSDMTTYTITGLSAGFYYFAVTAYDYDGLESGYSEILSQEIF